MRLVLVSGYNQQSTKSNQAFLDGLKPVVFVGRILCVLSRDDVLKKQEESHRKSFGLAVICGAISIFFLINACLLLRANVQRFEKDVLPAEKFGELSTPSYAFTMSFVYCYQLFATKKFRNIVLSFVEANRITQLSTPFPATYKRFCWLALTICMACGITENAMFDVQNLRKSEKSESNSTLSLYHAANFYHWSEIVAYHPITTAILVVIIKLGTWGWVFMDIIIIVICRAITVKFKVLHSEVEQLVLHQKSQTIHIITPISSHLQVKSKILEESSHRLHRITGGFMLSWDSVRDEFLLLTELVAHIEKFVGPLIIACYGANMYIIVVMLLNWIAPYSTFSPEQSSYTYFAFCQFLFRVTSVTYFAAEVHHVSHQISGIVQKCPNSSYTLSLERLERTFICNPTGISLFGSFMITRNFFLSIISFIFTTEIVLLQTANSYPNKV